MLNADILRLCDQEATTDPQIARKVEEKFVIFLQKKINELN